MDDGEVRFVPMSQRQRDRLHAGVMGLPDGLTRALAASYDTAGAWAEALGTVDAHVVLVRASMEPATPLHVPDHLVPVLRDVIALLRAWEAVRATLITNAPPRAT